MSGPLSDDRQAAGQVRGTAPPAADPAAALSGRAAPDPWSDGERNAQTEPTSLSRAGTTAAPQQLAVGRGAAYAQAQANAQGQARAAYAAAVQAQEAAREAELAQGEAAAIATAPAYEIPPRRDLRPRKPRAALTLGRLHVGQIVVWQSALLGALAALALPTAWMIAVFTVCAVAIALTAVPLGERWLYQWVGLRLRYATRGKRQGSTDAPASGEVSRLARGAVIESIEIDEQALGLVSHDTGYTAVIEAVRPLGTGQSTTEVDLPPFDQLIPAYDPDEPPVSVQIVISTIPAPGLRIDDAVGQSYRELAEGKVPAQRRTWIAIQALHTPDVHSPRDMTAALVNVLRRVERKLEKSGLSVHVLRDAELRDEFDSLTGVRPGQPRSDSTAREHWDHWEAGNLRHVTFRILNWPDLSNADGAELVQSLATVPAISVTVSVAICRDGETNEIEAAVRVVVPDRGTLAHAVDQMNRVATASGAQLQRLDGEHRFGVSASMPLGGFAA